MNMQALLKQAQKMQKEINQAESKCNEQIYESSMGGGGVKVTVKGSMEVLSIEIEKDLLNEEEKETLQDLIVCTVNDALKKAENEKTAVMKKLTSGVKMPGGF